MSGRKAEQEGVAAAGGVGRWRCRSRRWVMQVEGSKIGPKMVDQKLVEQINKESPTHPTHRHPAPRPRPAFFLSFSFFFFLFLSFSFFFFLFLSFSFFFFPFLSFSFFFFLFL